ncbi:MAG: desulfoferrodoxin FeS4 iron-binding protein [Herbinix sp.]|jgi:superoxide reductase|nr:desulfoferrodoxin FeS4 iron-binding protein [Herbinix sp.]
MSNVVFYRCKVCGNLVAMINNGGGTLVCCEHPMTKLEANSTDASQEKHVPEVVREDGKIKVRVGSVLHPSLPEHFIQWIALVTDDKVQLTYLKPGMDPTAEFEEVESGTVYEYCNLHGLWKTEF